MTSGAAVDQLDLFMNLDTPTGPVELPPTPIAPVAPAFDGQPDGTPYVEEGASCSRSPCTGPTWDPKTSVEEIEAARLLVGAPKLRRGMLRIDGEETGKFYVKGPKKGRPKLRPLPIWQGLSDYNRPGDPSWPLAVSYGIGIDSTAVLVGLVQIWRETRDPRFRPQAITFADTGGEKIATYAYMEIMNAWLRRSGFPEITAVAWAQSFDPSKSWGSHRTLEQKCLNNHTLPSITMSGFKRSDCSITWKHEPQDWWFQQHSGIYLRQHDHNTRSYLLGVLVENGGRVLVDGLAETASRRLGVTAATVKTSLRSLIGMGLAVRVGRDMEATPAGVEAHRSKALMDVRYALPAGVRIVKAIGYDATEIERLDPEAEGSTFRAGAAGGQELEDYLYWYPLMDWGWSRARCYAEIEREVGAVPPKSSCTFCGAMRPEEVRGLEPEELRRAIFMEQVALRGRHARGEAAKVKGIGFKWSWTDYALGIPTSGMTADARRQIAELGPVITQAEVDELTRLADAWIAASPSTPGSHDYAETGAAMGLAAFTRVRGIRPGNVGWDLFRLPKANPPAPYDPLLQGTAV